MLNALDIQGLGCILNCLRAQIFEFSVYRFRAEGWVRVVPQTESPQEDEGDPLLWILTKTLQEPS